MSIAKWFKIDFHTHTPESRCFKDKSVTPEQWLKAAKEAGLDAVVITDHNSVGYLNKIEEAQRLLKKEDRIKVFYGIELCVSADFTHFIIIFDDKLKINEIEDAVISDLKLKRDRWNDTTINVSEDSLKALCKELSGRVFVIPAHFTENKGLGNSNINEIKKYSEFVSFPAIEVRSEKDVLKYNYLVKEKAIKPATLISGSDNPSKNETDGHSIEGFGEVYTWIKTSSLTFEGLRQVFIDPENRCINHLKILELGLDYNPNETLFNYVSKIKLSGFKHIDNLEMKFSPQLNCIIGGRGTGKSTLVEAIHYGLNNSNLLSKCELMDKTLLDGGQIETTYKFGYQKEYSIECKRNRKELYYQYSPSGDDIIPEFKIDYYGQKDIYSIIDPDNNDSSDKTPLIKMIDDYYQSELYEINDDISGTLSELQTLSTNYRDVLNMVKDLPSVNAEITKNESLLERFNNSGVNEKHQLLESIKGSIKTAYECSNSFEETLKQTIEVYIHQKEYFEEKLQLLDRGEAYNYSSIALIENLLNSTKKILETLTIEQNNTDSKINDFTLSDIHKKKSETENDYLNFLKELKVEGVEEIPIIQSKLTDNKNRKSKLEELEKDRVEIISKIKIGIRQLIEKRLLLTKKRKEAIEKIKTDGLSVSVIPFGNIIKWKNSLQKEFGRNTYDDDFRRISEYILKEDEDFKNYYNFLFYVLTSEDGKLSIENLALFSNKFLGLWEEKAKNGTLYSLGNVLPEDSIEIKIHQDGGEIDILDGSPGQKCAALLTLILNTGDNPLIIDQPEDDLDNSLIYNLVVKSIRAMKKRRQIIIVTHNANIPVLGDAENIIMLERDHKGKVVYKYDKPPGCIEEIKIREGICDIMEGGIEAFQKREKKYNHNFI